VRSAERRARPEFLGAATVSYDFQFKFESRYLVSYDF